MWPLFSVQSIAQCAILFFQIIVLCHSMPIRTAIPMQRSVRSSKLIQNLTLVDTLSTQVFKNAESPIMQRLLKSTISTPIATLTTQQPLIDSSSPPSQATTTTNEKLIRQKRRGGRLGGKGSHSGIGHGRTGARQDSRQSGANNVFPQNFLILVLLCFSLFVLSSTFLVVG